MSRIGKKTIIIPSNATAEIKDGAIFISGPKGKLSFSPASCVKINKQDDNLNILVENPADQSQAAIWGLSRKLVNNMLIGVIDGFSKQLEINGVGYKAVVKGKILVLNIGHSHPINYQIPEGIEVSVEKNIITITGADKQMVGQVAAEIRSTRKVEPYKGKGIKYVDEHVRRKAGKQAAKTE